MAEPYLTELKSLIPQNCNPSVADAITCKHFFSGAAAYIDGQIFMSLSPAGLALKLPDRNCAALFAQGATPLQYFPKASVKKGYAVLPAPLAEDGKALRDWIRAPLPLQAAETCRTAM